ncbi:hypothetical protein I4P36_14580 [Enterobacter kobei]|uniref:hypothetical protein n=1 Tax=Enterobacter kobei TaxID=208224 RepID=UPI0018C22D2C|nr:hypothetical protein [Enterobacter kobei]MBG0682720.1 hypothetical protein [Enterobacter kobei]
MKWLSQPRRISPLIRTFLSKDSSIETAKNTADNLYQLMELINSNITDMDIEQIISLSGLCLDLSAQVSMWMDSEFERREKQRN